MNMSSIRLLFIFLCLMVLTNQHIIFARPVPITGDIIPDKETGEVVDAKAHIISQDGTEVIRTVFDDGKHEDGEENDGKYGTVVDLPDGIYEVFLNSTIFDESENTTYSEQSQVIRLVIPSLQIDTEIIKTANRQGTLDLEIRYRFIDKIGEGRQWPFSFNFGLPEQICDGKIVDEKGQSLGSWNPAETARVSINLAPYGVSSIIFTSCFEDNFRYNGSYYMTNFSMILGVPPKQGIIMNTEDYKSQIRIPKKKYLIKELRIKEINPLPDIVLEEGDYRVFQWNKLDEVSPTRFKDYRIVQYDYRVPWTVILLGFIGMSIALAFERIVNFIVAILKRIVLNFRK